MYAFSISNNADKSWLGSYHEQHVGLQSKDVYRTQIAVVHY